MDVVTEFWCLLIELFTYAASFNTVVLLYARLLAGIGIKQSVAEMKFYKTKVNVKQ